MSTGKSMLRHFEQTAEACCMTVISLRSFSAGNMPVKVSHDIISVDFGGSLFLLFAPLYSNMKPLQQFFKTKVNVGTKFYLIVLKGET